MLDRVTTSRHFSTAAGFFAATLGVFLALALIVGVAVLLSHIARMVN